MNKLTALLLGLTLILCGCTAPRESWQRFSQVYYDAFDTVIVLTVYAESEADFRAAASDFEAELLRLDAIFDAYEPHEGVSGLWALNRAEGAWTAVEPELLALLEQCREWRALGGERVNIALGGPLQLWHDCREAGVELPTLEALRSAAAHADMDDIELDPEGGRVRLRDAEMRLDLGAVAKGWAVERLAKRLEARCPDYLINAGGNVRAGKRDHDARGAWRVGITDPSAPEALLGALDLREMSAVTSGGYQRYYEVDGVRYHHLIDPDTLMPANYMAQVTILTEDSGLADYLSTTAFLLPMAESRALVERLDGVEAIWVCNDGTIEMTEGASALMWNDDV